MPNLAPTLAACSLLLGCGMSSGRISVGDSLTIDLHRTPATTAIQVMVGKRACAAERSSAMTLTWHAGAARVRTC